MIKLVFCLFFLVYLGCSGPGFFYHQTLGVANRSTESVDVYAEQEYGEYIWEKNDSVNMFAEGNSYVIDKGGVFVFTLEPGESKIIYFANWKSDFSQKVVMRARFPDGQVATRSMSIVPVRQSPYQRTRKWIIDGPFSGFSLSDIFGGD